MQTLCDLWVPGIPRPKGSMTHIGAGRMRNASANVSRWQRMMADSARHDMSRRGTHLMPRGAAVSVGCVFMMPHADLPEPREPAIAERIGDVDKLLRCVLDALTGVAYEDDVQVISARESRFYAGTEGPGAVVTATGLTLIDVDVWRRQAALEIAPRLDAARGER